MNARARVLKFKEPTDEADSKAKIIADLRRERDRLGEYSNLLCAEVARLRDLLNAANGRITQLERDYDHLWEQA